MSTVKSPGIYKTWSETDRRKSEVGIGYPDSLGDLFLKIPRSKSARKRPSGRGKSNGLLVKRIMDATFTLTTEVSLEREQRLTWLLRTLRKKKNAEDRATSNREKSE